MIINNNKATNVYTGTLMCNVLKYTGFTIWQLFAY